MTIGDKNIMKVIVEKNSIPAGQFKTHCLELMDQVQKKKNTIIITKRGKPVAKLIPIDEEKIKLFGFLKGNLIEQGNIIDSIDTEWEASNE